jgi:diadenylate cyclase
MTDIIWILQNFPQDWHNVLDVLLVTLVFFLVFRMVRGTRAATLLRGIAILLVLVWALSTLLRLHAFSWLLSHALTALAVALPVIFQPELRRVLDSLGRAGALLSPSNVPEEWQTLISEICEAVAHLSGHRHGALIVLERETGLQEYVDTGVRLDANLSSELLQTVFYPNTTLHDGAVIVRGNRAIAAACVLPLSTARHISDGQMGLRHRAGLGISEVSDAIAVVVSEETGRISMVVSGRFIRGLDTVRLAMILRQYFQRQAEAGLIRWLAHLRRPDRPSDQVPSRA